MEQQTPNIEPKKRGHAWAVPAVVIAGALAAAMVYAVWEFGKQPFLSDNAAVEIRQQDEFVLEDPAMAQATQALSQYGSSNEISVLEEDLDQTTIEGLDAELELIERELE